MCIDWTFKPLDVIVSLLGILLGTGLGGLIGYRSARSASEMSLKSSAVAKLRASFAPALAKISLIKSLYDGEKILVEEFPNHAIAIEEFRPFVGGKNDIYNQAWLDYKKEFEK